MKNSNKRIEGSSLQNGQDEYHLSQAIAEIPTNGTIGLRAILEDKLQKLTQTQNHGFEEIGRTQSQSGNQDLRGIGITNEVTTTSYDRATNFSQQGSVPLGKGSSELRLRKKNSQLLRAETRKQRMDDGDNGGIFGSKQKPGKLSLSNYFQSVASTREKRIVAVSAWLIAMGGLLVSLVFVTLDFIQGRQEQATAVNYVDADVLELPSLWMCTTDTQAPPFSNLPTAQYKGHPVFWMDYLRVASTNTRIAYPNTTKLPQMKLKSVDALGKPCTLSETMNPAAFEEELRVKPNCFYCFMLSRTPAIRLLKFEEGETDEDNEHPERKNLSSTDHASIRMSQNSFISACKTSQLGINKDMFFFFRDEIKKNHVELERRGTLNFGSLDPSNTTNDQYLWPNYRRGFRNTTRDIAVFDIVDMFCNTYMFAGYFYPSTELDVKFQFNEVQFRWERSGTGRYYPRVYSDFYDVVGSSKMPFNDNPEIGMEKYENLSLYSGTSVNIMTNNSHFGGAETMVVLENMEMGDIQLTRNVIRGRESYTKKVLHTTVDIGDVRTINNVYFVEVSFTTFLTRIVSDQLTISWPAFIADFFGLTSLFLDVSVYTLLVAPLIVRARKRAIDGSRVAGTVNERV